MKKIALIGLHVLAVLVLTVFTQVGGIIYLIALLWPKRLLPARPPTWLLRMSFFLSLYLLSSYWIVPQLAPLFGRKPLPNDGSLRAHHWHIPLLNRHYAKPALHEVLVRAAAKQDLQTYYLDAGFPFWDWFLMFPHLSHGDGNQVDVAFYYRDPEGKQVKAPPLSGYGYYDGAKPGEVDYSAICTGKGYWQYDVKAGGKKEITEEAQPDHQATVQLIRALTAQPRVGKIFLEPHLKARWGLSANAKVRFHGCQASRHDDHFHLMAY